MSIILNIETSNKNCSVSISESGNIIGLEEQYFEQYSHSKYLHVFIDKLFKKTKLSPSDLSAVAISEGPGSYTGLRIGVYKSLKDISKKWHLDKRFSPKMKNKNRSFLIKGWEKAVERALIN